MRYMWRTLECYLSLTWQPVPPTIHSIPFQLPNVKMRLLEVHTMKLNTFYGDHIPHYAILSHNWLRDDEEVTFPQIQDPAMCQGMRGFRKIKLLCDQAKRDGYQYAWIDTCCIDKSNSSELSEAINSMFSWYKQSGKCYAYLADFAWNHWDSKGRHSDFLESRWWSRAWYIGTH
jgi:hypothetical protein